MSVIEFMADLAIELAAEQVADNSDLPPEFVPIAHHYRLEISLPGGRESFTFSVPAVYERPARPDPVECLIYMAQTVNDYRANPEPSAWAAAKGLPDLPGIHAMWHTFARDEAKLVRLFGEHMDRFLALDPRRRQGE
jgi:hypothetical protein